MPMSAARWFSFSEIFAAGSPGTQMPERSPFTSAQNTGTPAAENCSAMICRVTVLPVPVAPATSPCRLARHNNSVCGVLWSGPPPPRKMLSVMQCPEEFRSTETRSLPALRQAPASGCRIASTLLRPMFSAPRFMFGAEFSSRFARSVWKAYARAFKGPYFVERRMGARWLLDQHNIIDRRLFCEGVWEEEQVARLTGYAQTIGGSGARPHFLDIGSHAGFYAVLMRRSGLFDRVLAFEPMPAHLDLLAA